MHDGVFLQVIGVAQDADKGVLGRDVLVDAVPDDQAGQSHAVRNLLEEGAGAAEDGRREPDTTPAIDDQADGEVEDGDHDASHDDGFAIVARLAHLRNDRNVHGRSALGQEQIGRGNHTRDKVRVADTPPAQVEWALLGGRGGSVLLGHGHGEDEDGDEEGEKPEPSEPSQLGEGAHR